MTMNRYNGKAIGRTAHLKQSINDILTTRLGSRLARREYGSLLPDLIDAPVNPETNLKLIAASVLALMQHEPRLVLNRVQITQIEDNGLTLLIDGQDRNDNELNFDVPMQLGGV